MKNTKRKSISYRHQLQTLEEIEDTKRVIRIRKSEDRQQNGAKKKDKRRKNDLQNSENKRSSNTNPTISRDELRCSGRVSRSCSTMLKNITVNNKRVKYLGCPVCALWFYSSQILLSYFSFKLPTLSVTVEGDLILEARRVQ